MVNKSGVCAEKIYVKINIKDATSLNFKWILTNLQQFISLYMYEYDKLAKNV